MSADEIIVLVVAVLIGLLSSFSTSSLHRLALRQTAGLGLVRASIVGAMLWILFVLLFHADPSVTGRYVVFYLILGYAVLKSFGQAGTLLFQVRAKADVVERGNWAAACFVAAFILATGLVFGGSLWGEADPDGDGEGGWWIPMGFFISGWLSLLAATALYFWREPGPTRKRIRQERKLGEAKAASFYVIGAGCILAESVAGDFHGWIDGLTAVGSIAGMLVTHEIFLLTSRKFVGAPDLPPPPETERTRWLEAFSYLVWIAISWLSGRWLLHFFSV